MVTLKENGKDADLEAGTLYSIVLEKISDSTIANSAKRVKRNHC